MKDLRIVFMGTPDFAVATLKTLVEHNYTGNNCPRQTSRQRQKTK